MESWTLVHLILAFIHALVGVYVLGWLGNSILKTEQQVYWTKPETEEKNDEFHYNLEKQHIFSVSPIAIHGAVSLITALSHLIAAYIYRDLTHGVKNQRPNTLRWTEYSITATLMTLSGYISVGQGDIYILTTVTVLGVFLQVCGYFIEKDVKKGTWWRYLWIGSLIQFLIVLPVTAWTTSAEIGNGGLFAAWVAYSVYYALFPLNAFYDAKYKKNFRETDKRYVVLSFTSKMALLCKSPLLVLHLFDFFTQSFFFVDFFTGITV